MVLPLKLSSSSSSSSSDDATIQTTKAVVEEELLKDETSSLSSSLLFDDFTWEAYKSIVQQIIHSPRVLKKGNKRNDFAQAEAFLLSPPVVVLEEEEDGDADNHHHHHNNNETTATTAKEPFMHEYNLTGSEYDYVMRCLVYMGDACAKNQSTAHPIVVAWHKLKQAKIIPRENCISTYMYILSNNLNKNNNNNNNNNDKNRDDDDDDDNLIGDALNEVATFHDLHYKPSETTISLRIKYLIESKNAIEQAEEILASCDFKKLRTFLPIMEYYCKVAQSPTDILRVYNELRQSPVAYLDSELYGLMIGSLARLGVFCAEDDNGAGGGEPVAVVVEGFQSLGYNNSHGPKLFDEIASRMADDLLEVSEAVAKELFDSFMKGYSKNNDCAPSDDTDAEGGSTSWDSVLNEPGIATAAAAAGGITMGRVAIDNTTALCATTGAKLRLFALDETQRQHVHDTLLEMARIRHQEFAKQQKNTDDEGTNHGFEALLEFSQWLE
jgi:hypothetical protein